MVSERSMICLGIESTAHTFGVGVMTGEGKVLANAKDLYTTESGGIIPNAAANHHIEVCDRVLERSLKLAGITLEDVDLISYSQSPGLGNCLRVGSMFARSLAAIHKKELVGVNHCIAHLEIGKLLTDATDPVFLYASGANTQVIAFEEGKYRIFGETLDIGIGNFLDSFARELGLGFPGGPKLYELSLKAKSFVPLPYCVKGMDVSFGGILTNVKQKYRSGKFSKEDLAFSAQETTFAMLVEVCERAMAHCDKKELLLGGGVAASLRLQEMCRKMCEERGAKAFFVENQFNTDNGAMIAWLGILQHNAGQKLKVSEAGIDAYLRTDQVEVFW